MFSGQRLRLNIVNAGTMLRLCCRLGQVVARLRESCFSVHESLYTRNAFRDGSLNCPTGRIQFGKKCCGGVAVFGQPRCFTPVGTIFICDALVGLRQQLAVDG